MSWAVVPQNPNPLPNLLFPEKKNQKLLGYDDRLDRIRGEEDRINKRKNSEEVLMIDE
jgi:hypothetical protein